MFLKSLFFLTIFSMHVELAVTTVRFDMLNVDIFVQLDNLLLRDRLHAVVRCQNNVCIVQQAKIKREKLKLKLKKI